MSTRAFSRFERCLTLLLAVAVITLPAAHAGGPKHEPVQVTVFVAGDAGYDTYRIPAVVTTANGTVLAFCEGRRNSASDYGDIDIVLKRSNDKGATWSQHQVIVDDGTMSCNNPAPIVDLRSNTVILVFTKHPGDDREDEILDGSAAPCTVWTMKSVDDGNTWTTPREITQQVSKPEWRWYATGPCHGIRTQRNGRIVVPCNHSLAPNPSTWYSHAIASDDMGETWTLLGAAGPHCNESTLLELPDGGLYLNMRSYHGKNRRHISRSADGGVTWSEPEPDSALVEPVCQAGCLRLDLEGGKPRFLFSNPASTKRERMTVRVSQDACETWSKGRVLHEGPSAYSDLSELSDGTIGCLYERGKKGPYESVYFARFSLGWLDR
ncbi:MAG: exo-alpha-sialidase [Candidatus Hydrogenedentes bacterium]|nr:exo-alpha-sialidase [Candidatus Hydrogenedentota bacterium]